MAEAVGSPIRLGWFPDALGLVKPRPSVSCDGPRLGPGAALTGKRAILARMSERKILVTGALPYVNGHLHLGHLVGYVQADIFVRYQRMQGHEVRYFCGDDTHGTATMIRAREEGREPEEILQEMSTSHQRDFNDFSIEFDHYGSTHSESNRETVYEIWSALRESGRVQERDVTQLFDTEAGVFLADRFVKGECPKCGAPDQYGDNCEVCGGIYEPHELGNPTSTAPHYFVTLEEFHEFLEDWTQAPGKLQPEVANQLKGSFLSEPLRDWDVSRPAPYFGFEIPDAPGHFFYVWVDAPIGYIAATRDWCENHGERLEDWWKNPDCEIHHFIGKDIVYFHALFWPAMLESAGYSLPHHMQVNGFLTVNGEKMSKRKGTFVQARTYLEHLAPDYLRYYLASKSGSNVTDLDLNLDEFTAKVNSDLVGKLINLASRTARFVKGQTLCDPYPDDGGLFERGAAAGHEIAEAYEQCDTNKVTRIVMGLADRANEYVEAGAPWALKKQEGKEEEIRQVCSVALNLFRQLTTYLQPILPDLSVKANALLGQEGESRFEEAQSPLEGAPVGKFKHLMQRVDPDRVQAMVDASVSTD
jgi:methionyl-tRNA synthetase